jgi:hypothetical protein
MAFKLLMSLSVNLQRIAPPGYSTVTQKRVAEAVISGRPRHDTAFAAICKENAKRQRMTAMNGELLSA